jgi:hypothetical protein
MSISSVWLALLAVTLAGCTHPGAKSEIASSNRRTASETQANPLALIPDRLKCSAVSIDSGAVSGSVAITMDATEDPLITVTSKSPALNFKIGRRFAAGNDYTKSTSLDCRYLLDQEGSRGSLDYFCDTSPLPEDTAALNPRDYQRRSTLIFSVGETENIPTRICRTFRSCVDLKDCSAF